MSTCVCVCVCACVCMCVPPRQRDVGGPPRSTHSIILWSEPLAEMARPRPENERGRKENRSCERYRIFGPASGQSLDNSPWTRTHIPRTLAHTRDEGEERESTHAECRGAVVLALRITYIEIEVSELAREEVLGVGGGVEDGGDFQPLQCGQVFGVLLAAKV